MAQIPHISGEWRLLFRPERSGCYVNDHSILRARDGQWHLFGITSFAGKPSAERWFVHASGESLDRPMTENGVVLDTGTLAWAPGVIDSGEAYYMYYGPSPTKLAVSPDLNEWMGYEIEMAGVPPMACHRDHFVMRLNDYTWALYASGVYRGHGCISCFVSNDLLRWRFVQYALTSSPEAPLQPAWGAFESPYVVARGGMYYLFTTYTDCRKENYQDTLVFCSPNPYDFGCYTGSGDGSQPITKLHSHAGEVIRDPVTGNDYLTACGWNDFGIPVEGAVAIAPLAWE